MNHALQAIGVGTLYVHQHEATTAAHEGQDVVISTGTASGKTLCYLLPILSAITETPRATALCLYPAKALAYDQLTNLERLVSGGSLGDLVRPACYDGDTPSHKRPGIRRNANVILSNPDMLHQGILPYHPKWASVFANLRYVVLDEIHACRGIFGSHVAGVIRRLLRVCRHYGSSPQFICCSATLANPREHAERLTGRAMRLIDKDGSPRGRRFVALWNPPWQDDRTRVARRSGNAEATHLMRLLLEEGAGTIVFAKARVVAELIYAHVADALRKRRPDLARRVLPYRGGYLPNERREIEQRLASGALLGVCATNALELGIDIGSLDAAVVVGFPGTLCSLWQQMGRAGRRQADSLSIFVAYDDPVDQYFMRNPQFLFDQPLEQAIIDPENPHVLAAQLGCAAAELPLEPADLEAFGANAAEVARLLTEDGPLRHAAGRYYWASPAFAAAKTNLRTISDATFAIVDVTGGRNEVIGQVDSISAPELVYPEAIYLHQGASYLVRELDYPMRLARVERSEADYYTQPMLAGECRVTREELQADCFAGRRFFGDVSVRWQTVAFRRFKLFTQELIGQTALDLPAQQIDTTGAWFQPPPEALDATRKAGFDVHEALGGARSLLTVALPPIAMCDRYDIGGVVNASQFGVSTIILYDRHPGGMGYARCAYERFERLVEMALDLVSRCPCERGCPGCVGPPNLRVAIHHDPDLGGGYAIPDKYAARTLLSAWCDAGGRCSGPNRDDEGAAPAAAGGWRGRRGRVPC